ncbi:acyltransferase family protein [Chlamydia ibidis]|uniref:Acyltransferase family protein n=2 Tax=Chlamydia ibidis TaxID=1405396 RepID=S7J2R6_9CHLA|nr:1-acyl-sn-glycerol-3-phosphate acyltransferase [Chlamydia ibidis]EPP34538.1 acyltransferase family protein [Chlamydia ibidis]EQM62332.1 acyltransferase family protein [Chlamydia ibidis 10-1398/6]
MLIKAWRIVYETIYAFLVGSALKLRYNIKLEGLESLRPNANLGSLFLSNHVAEIDPVILEYLFWPRFRVRPLAIDYLFHSPFVRWLLNSVRAIPVPRVTPGKECKSIIAQMEHFYTQATDALNAGESLLLYPSGRLSRNGKEEIVNQYSAYVLLHRAKECNVFLVRISGLWGSSFSRYKTGTTPKLGSVFKESLKALLCRGLFFMPKRSVLIRIQQIDNAFLKKFSKKQDLNAFLTSWFNQCDENLPVEVPYA